MGYKTLPLSPSIYYLNLFILFQFSKNMNGLERFALETEHPEELIRPITGDHLILIHLAGKFPCKIWNNNLRIMYELVENTYDFLDQRFSYEQMTFPHSQLMWLIDQNLRETYKTEENAIARIDEAIGKTIQENPSGSKYLKFLFSTNPQDYISLFEVVSPIYSKLRKLNKFTFEDFFS